MLEAAHVVSVCGCVGVACWRPPLATWRVCHCARVPGLGCTQDTMARALAVSTLLHLATMEASTGSPQVSSQSGDSPSSLNKKSCDIQHFQLFADYSPGKEVGAARARRQAATEEGVVAGQHNTTGEPLLVEAEEGWGLAHVLGIASLVCLVIYIIGITYKLIKMHLGTYVREDPVFLKYK